MAVKFKGVEIDDDLQGIIPHLAAAEEYGGALQHLQSVWDSLTLLGELSGTTTDMSSTRLAFTELAENLLNQLGREALKKCLQDLGAKAQVAIDILVRNLFERTADIGFLACDEDIRAFLRNRDACEGSQCEGLRRRFGEYIRKYSVYSDVILLDPEGNVLARFDDAVQVAASNDPGIRAAIDTSAGYVESFHHSDLFTAGKRSLLYSFRVADTDGAVLGVLCLCFRLENEADLIFSGLVGGDEWAIVMILDQAGAVVASSDPLHIPVGAKFAPVCDTQYRIVRFGPTEYIALSRAAHPYQGYGGPGWYGHVMVPLQHAFSVIASQTLASVDPALIERIIKTSQLFNEELRAIPVQAERIQQELNRSVWNGNLKKSDTAQAGSSFLKTLLKEISSTGVKTKDVFQSSFADLNKTVVMSLLHDNQFHAALAIDIMDRNLYERANDCRWWALASVFATLLAQPQMSDQDVQTIRSTLRTINGLYTVYSNLIVFDRRGRIVAVSDAGSSELEGTVLSEPWAADILALRGSEAYTVSPFAPTRLYADRPTYIYGAAIADPGRNVVVGGVAIVFDAAPQFAAMLNDALPRDDCGAVKHGAFGVLAQPDGRIIACSDGNFRPGDTLSMDAAFLRLSAGISHSGFAVVGDSYYAVGAKASSGYREYKGATDAYRNDVVALVFTRLCGANARAVAAPAKTVSIRSDRMQGGPKDDIATFFIGRRPFAARAAEIVEAIEAPTIAPLPRMPRSMAGCLTYHGKPLPVFNLISVLEEADARPPGEDRPTLVIIMVTSGGERFGALVDGLGEIVEVAEGRVRDLPAMVTPRDTYADAALAPDGENDDLVVVLRADRLYAYLAHFAPAVAAA